MEMLDLGGVRPTAHTIDVLTVRPLSPRTLTRRRNALVRFHHAGRTHSSLQPSKEDIISTNDAVGHVWGTFPVGHSPIALFERPLMAHTLSGRGMGGMHLSAPGGAPTLRVRRARHEALFSACGLEASQDQAPSRNAEFTWAGPIVPPRSYLPP